MEKTDLKLEAFLRQEAKQRKISRSEWEVMALITQGYDIPEIAEHIQIQASAVRQRLSQVYDKFEIEGRGPVKLAKLQKLLMSRYQEYQTVLPDTTSNTNIFKNDWGEAPKLSGFHGRQQQLTLLKNQILQQQCRLLAIQGMGGIGKTSLIVKLGQILQNQSYCLFWRSLKNTPSLSDLLTELLEFLNHEIDIPESTEGKISLLIKQLNSSPCLIILDDAEQILQSGSSGKYIPGYDDYGLFFEVVGESQHQSCLVVISQEKIREISLSAQLSSQVHQFFLEGLNAEEVEQLLQEQGLKGTANNWQELVHYYGGNPLALKLLSLMVMDIFQGEIGGFLKYGTIVLTEGFKEILDPQFDRLSDTQKQILFCLSEADKPLSLKDLQEKLSNFLSLSKILEPLESLLGRSLVEKIQHQPGNEVLFSLQPLIQKYIKQQQLSGL